MGWENLVRFYFADGPGVRVRKLVRGPHLHKALLEHSHAPSFAYRLCLCLCHRVENSCGRDHPAFKAKVIYFLALYRESFHDPQLEYKVNRGDDAQA